MKQAFLEYRYCAAVRAGELLIRPLSQRQLGATTDLLTQSFSEAIGYFSVYRCTPVLSHLLRQKGLKPFHTDRCPHV